MSFGFISQWAETSVQSIRAISASTSLLWIPPCCPRMHISLWFSETGAVAVDYGSPGEAWELHVISQLAATQPALPAHVGEGSTLLFRFGMPFWMPEQNTLHLSAVVVRSLFRDGEWSCILLSISEWSQRLDTLTSVTWNPGKIAITRSVSSSFLAVSFTAAWHSTVHPRPSKVIESSGSQAGERGMKFPYCGPTSAPNLIIRFCVSVCVSHFKYLILLWNTYLPTSVGHRKA